jgi:hypothetical protein
MPSCVNCHSYIPNPPADYTDEQYDISIWWSADRKKVWVCSPECKDDLKKLVENNGFMLWRHLKNVPQPAPLSFPDTD